MQAFFENNWLSILSIIIGIVVAYVFYRLQRKDSASASAERKKHATAELLDVVESYIINKQRLSEDVIENLIRASERDHTVALRPGCTAVTLLQDVALRLQRSRHLDIPQKSEYSEKIEHLIAEILESRTPVRIEEIDTELSAQVEKLAGLTPAEHRSEARTLINSIAGLGKKRRQASLADETRKEVLPIAAALLGVTASLASTLIGTKLFDTLGKVTTSAAFDKLLPALGVMLALVVVMAAISTLLRIKRRDHQARDRGEGDG